jgi:hypothetical protein
MIRAFSATFYYVQEAARQQSQAASYNIDEVQKALALFMFDSMDDVTEENLRKQRNALNKAFYPDNNEQKETYSQKINAAYDLLSGMIKSA